MITRNPNKLKHLILYFIKQHAGEPNFGKVRLAKLLFEADFEHFRRTGEAITGRSYVGMQQGPVPEDFDDFLERMQARQELSFASEPMGPYTQQRPVARAEPDLSLFSPGEMEVIDAVVREQHGMTAGEVSKRSHEHVGWQAARPGERIPYGTAWIVDPPPEPTEKDHEIARQIAAKLGRL